MALHVEIVSDFVCPYCYLLEALLHRVEEHMDLEVRRLPYELTEPPAPREDTYHDPQRRARYAQQLDPVCRRIGLKMHLPPRVTPRPYTDLAFRGWHYAQEQGKGDVYHARVFRAYFEEELDIGDREVLAALAGEAGLEPADFLAALERDDYAAREAAAVRYAKETLKIRMVPTVLVGERRLEGFISSAEELEQWLREAANTEKEAVQRHRTQG